MSYFLQCVLCLFQQKSKLFRCFFLIYLIDCAQVSLIAQESTTNEESQTTFSYSLVASLGCTFQNISRSAEDETLTAQWLASLQGRMNWEGEVLGLSGSLFSQYGQLHTKDFVPEKTQDNLIVSMTPSLSIFPSIGLRIFLENTAETQMQPGIIDTSVTNFLDPLFLYQAVFVGQKITSTADNGSGELSLTYGLGYALQQTFTQDFITTKQGEQLKRDPNSPISNVDLELGITGVIDLTARKQLSDNFTLTSSLKTIALGKEETYKDLEKARVSFLGLTSLSYGVVSLDYTCRIVYDSNFSPIRQLDQTLVFGMRLNL
jgi:hypothetical protein